MRHARTIAVALAALSGLALLPQYGLAEEKAVTKYVRFQVGRQAAYGIVEGENVRQIQGNLFGKWKTTDTLHKLSEVKLLVPTRPSKILAAAGNYKSHLGDETAPSHPQFFFKPPSCLIADGQKIMLPKDSAPVDHEGELVIVIGKRAKTVSKEKALEYVLGVTCGNDISARAWQKNDTQWWRAKGSDTFGPCGPCIVAGVNYDDLLLQLRVNGEVKQKQRTSDLIHGVAALVSFASQFVTLEPGDLIYTGTPGETSPIKPGDVLEVELEGVGVLRNPVVGE